MRRICFLAALAAGSLASATQILQYEHVDVDLFFDGAWRLGVKDADNFVWYPSDQAALLANFRCRTARAPGAQWDFLGVPAGSTIWIMPQTPRQNQIYLGVSSEDMPGGTFQGRIRLELVAVRGPGFFSVWQNDAFGNPIVRMTSANGIDANDFLEIGEGGHAHYNWAMTAKGTYEVTLRASAILNGTRVFSPPTRYFFAAERFVTRIRPVP
jgi:surface-anchored protein